MRIVYVLAEVRNLCGKFFPYRIQVFRGQPSVARGVNFVDHIFRDLLHLFISLFGVSRGTRDVVSRVLVVKLDHVFYST